MAKKAKYKFDKNPGAVLFTKQRKRGELLVCSRGEYYGERVHVRVWKLNENGAYFPTSNGLALRPAELELLLEALEAIVELENA